MSDTPFAPGGIVPSRGPGSDLVPAFLGPGEPVIGLGLVQRWQAGEVSLEEILRQAWSKPEKEVMDGDDDS